MQMQEDIEIQLWAYIDGQCSAEEKQRIEKLLATDPVWKTAYADINALHHSLQQAETEEPSLRFTQNTMDALEGARIAKRADKYLNSRLIRGMAACFILAIISMLGYAIATTNWQSSGTIPAQWSYTRLLNNNTLAVFVLINILLVLVFADGLLRRRNAKKHHHNPYV